jgi:cyclopropane-fatty-acyl-phospholipid synthase
MRAKKNLSKQTVTELLQLAGITINGDAPWDLQVTDERFYDRVLSESELTLGESYVDGWWDCRRIDLFIARVLDAELYNRLKNNYSLAFKLFLTKFLNFQTKTRALQVGKQHYDLGNELFQCMLDSNMNYSCGYWKNAVDLEQAQLAKMDLVCRKLMLKPGMRLLDIGCGWGGLAKYAAENHGVEVVGVTISKQQCELAKVRCKHLPIEIRFQDYRDLNEQFDRIVSIGMFEHVGHMNYRVYMQKIHDCLHPQGLFLLHTIGGNVSTTHVTPWISKYIFPNSMLPSVMQIGKASEGLLIMEDWQNFGPDYDKTLMAWHHNFNQHWPKLKSNYDERFLRMWNFYLLSCAGGFRARETQLWQTVFSKKGCTARYDAPR